MASHMKSGEHVGIRSLYGKALNAKLMGGKLAGRWKITHRDRDRCEPERRVVVCPALALCIRRRYVTNCHKTSAARQDREPLRGC